MQHILHPFDQQMEYYYFKLHIYFNCIHLCDYCIGHTSVQAIADSMMEELWQQVDALKKGYTGRKKVSVLVLNFCIFGGSFYYYLTCMTCMYALFQLCKKDHEARLRITEMQQEDQRKQVQQVVRQYTGMATLSTASNIYCVKIQRRKQGDFLFLKYSQ